MSGSEKWAAIEGLVGRYAVSSHGRVMSMDYAQSGLPGIMKPRLRDGRYLSVCLYDGNGGKRWHAVHLLVAAAFLPPKPEGHQCNHADGVRTNNRAGNLEWMTGSENMKHAFAIGLQHNRGERHSQARLTEDHVRGIRSLLRAGMPQASVAKTYRVNQSVISKINTRKAWPHVKEQIDASL
jgi:hypothetical protein